MPRPRRIDAPGYPQHVVQRGNNRQRVFFADGDRVAYLRLLCHHADQQHCRVHAYVLMDNHVHLLATPDLCGGLSRMMQAVNRTYVRRVNDRQGRTGTLWEGRFHSTVVDTDRYLLACQRYIELNPVRAGKVAHPGDYRWSSYRANARGRPNALLEPHSAFERMGLIGLKSFLSLPLTLQVPKIEANTPTALTKSGKTISFKAKSLPAGVGLNTA